MTAAGTSGGLTGGSGGAAGLAVPSSGCQAAGMPANAGFIGTADRAGPVPTGAGRAVLVGVGRCPPGPTSVRATGTGLVSGAVADGC